MTDVTETFDEVLDLMQTIGEVVTVSSPLRGPSATMKPDSNRDEVFYFRVYERFNNSLVVCLDVPLGVIPKDNVVRERLRDRVEWLPFCDIRFDRLGRDKWQVYLTHSLLVNDGLNGEAIDQVVGSLLHTKSEILRRPATSPFFQIVPQTSETNRDDLPADDTGNKPDDTAKTPDEDTGTVTDSTESVEDIHLDGQPGDGSWKNPGLRVLKRTMTASEVVSELNRLEGLQPVKDAARRLIANHRVQQRRKKAGLKVQQPAPHLVFTGNPGTGKTTVARLFGQLYRSLGLLSKGHVVEAKRSDLVAAYLGQTALRTRAICERALDGVLFIDEAYSLLGREYDYGAEVIQELLTQMETHRGRLVVIIAGYPAEIEQLLESNPGLKSRFDKTVNFPDFTDQQLLRVLDALVTANDYALTTEARELAEHAISMLDRGPSFGNARDVRKLFEELLQAQAHRLARVARPTDDQLRSISAADIAVVLQGRRPQAPTVPASRPRRDEGWGGYL